MNNAFTADDTTAFYEVIPSADLQRLLWAEADRMSALVVDKANFDSERQVVEEELRMRVLADPYGRLFNLDVPEASFVSHPYHRAPIGSIAVSPSATTTYTLTATNSIGTSTQQVSVTVNALTEKPVCGTAEYAASASPSTTYTATSIPQTVYSPSAGPE